MSITIDGKELETTEDLCRELWQAGLKAIPFRRPPITEEITALDLREDLLRLHCGSAAKVVVHTDPAKRQAVIVVDEKARKITRTMRFPRADKRHKNQYEARARQQFPIRIPNATFEKVKFTETKQYKVSKDLVDYEAQVTLSAPGQRNAFLVGMDETRQFISPLPRVATSVDDAHKALRPPRLNTKAVRQGEFFFKPIQGQELKDLEEFIHQGGAILRKHARQSTGWYGRKHQYTANGVALENDSTHCAEMLIHFDGKTYVRGKIWDRRVSHHQPIQLDEGWHQVIRNREVVAVDPGATIQRTRMWD